MRSLPLFHQIAGRPVIVLGSGGAGDAKRRLVQRAGGVVAGGEELEARLAFIALDEPEEAVQRLRARGVLVNVVDRPDLCDFTVPSLLDRDPVLVAVGTGGASAGLAKQLRLRLETLIPAGLGRLAQALFDNRQVLRERFPDGGERRRALDAAFAPGGPLDPLAEIAENDVKIWLADAATPAPVGPVELIVASDDPDDLTLRQARLLGTADAVLFEPEIAPAILDRARADAERRPLPHAGSPPSGLVLVLKRAAKVQ